MARSKLQRRTAFLRTFDALEERTLLSLNVLSATGIGGDNIYNGGAAIDSQGDIFACGEFAGTVNFDPQGSSRGIKSTDGAFDMFVAKYSPQGSLIW